MKGQPFNKLQHDKLKGREQQRFNSHTLYTGQEKDCPEAVIKWNAAVCKVCGAAESECYDFDCTEFRRDHQ